MRFGWFLIKKNIINQNKTGMKEFMDIMEKDIQSENFTKKEIIVFGIIVPALLIAILGIIGWLDSIGMGGSY